MLSNLFTFVKTKGSSLLPAHGSGGARATIIIKAPQNNRAKPEKQKGKKEGGLGGIPPLPLFSVFAFFAGAGGRILLCKMRRKKGCCSCPTQPVRGQRQGTPFCLYECE